MNRKVFSLLTYFILLLNSALFAQDKIVKVNPGTGTANVVIPLYTLKAAKVTLPMELVYNAVGIHALDVENTAGMGFRISAGGSISRQVRGIPDDMKQDMAGNARLGWMYKNNQQAILNLYLHNDLSPTDVAADQNTINSAFGDLSDTEPDNFNVDAPGLNCQLIYDKINQVFRPIPYRDLKITYTTNGNSGPTFGAITSFSITDDNGIIYTFSAPEVAFQKVVPPAPAPSGIAYFKNTYNEYLNGLTYYSSWDLTSIQDPTGNGIQLTYTTGTQKGFTSAIDLILATPSNPAQDALQYKLYGSVTPNLVSTISFSDGQGSTSNSFSFNWTTSGNYKDIISSISGFGRNFQFNYSVETSAGIHNLNRFFLRNLTDQDCSTPFNYSFSYIGETNNNGTYTTALPDSTYAGGQMDLWGFYNHVTSNTVAYPTIDINPSTAGYDRYRNHGSVAPPTSIYPYTMIGADMESTSSNSTGTLNKITYADGGSTTIVYEPNEYYDPAVTANVSGNGIRVVSITDYDGINTSNNIVKSFSYRDASGNSYGKPITMPIYAFTQPYSGSGTTANLWSYSTVRSSSDLSSEDHTILYSSVTETQTGMGSTNYQFAIPAVQWDNTISSPLSWNPTTTIVGSPTTSSIGFLSNDIHTYPFPSNLNYDFERELLTKSVRFNDAGQEVSESDYTYQTLMTPVLIPGFKYDVNSYGIGHAIYNTYTTTSPVITQVINKNFDLGSTTSSLNDTVSYTYNSSTNKLIKKLALNSDGSSEAVNVVYSKDYPTSTRTDNYTQCIYGLQQINVNIPIETYFQVKPKGASQFLTTKADLVLFGSSWPAYTSSILPVKKLKLVSQNGIASFAPASTSTGSFVYDSNYNVYENDIAYDYTGNVMTSNDNYNNIKTIIVDHASCKPTYYFKDANWNEVAYQDFDSRLIGSTFSVTGSLSTVSTSRSGQYGGSVSANTTLSQIVNRNLSAQSYVFSCWVQTNITGAMNVSVKGGSVTNNNSFSFDNTLGNTTTYPTGWQYCEVKVPLTGITSSTITVSITYTQAINIDDILIYPDVAEVSTYAYDPVTTQKTAETNTNGIALYYKYDEFGRLRYTYDQDKNITMRKIYAPGSMLISFTDPALTGPSAVYKNNSNTWASVNNYSSCVAGGITYTWDFGDGSPKIITSTNSGQTHTYTTSGTFTLSITASSPLYGTRTTTKTITVTPVTNVSIVYHPYAPSSSIYSVTFSQGGVVKYTFSTSQLQTGASVPAGAYSIDIHPTGRQYIQTLNQGYNAVVYTGSFTQCFPYTTSGDDITFDDLTNTPSISFTIQIQVCTGGGGGGQQ